jgi:hypothetical protein
MHKLNRFCVPIRMLAWLVLALFLSLRVARAEDFCAITLNVAADSGQPITSTWVELVDPTGKVVRREMMRGPLHRICDFGFGPHSLRVGTNECLPVTVSNLRLRIGTPLTLHVVLDGCGYQFHTGCLVYLRVVDADANAIPDVDFDPPLELGRPARTDSYGRYQTLVKGTYDLTFSKKGFDPKRVHLECRGVEEIDTEVVLKHAE